LIDVSDQPETEASAPPSRGNGILIAGFTILLVILVVLWYTAPAWEGPLGLGPKNPGSSQSFVSVTTTNWTFAGPASCWQGTVFSYGGIVPFGGLLEGSVALPYPGGATGPNCTAQSIELTTSGFTLIDSSTPVLVSPGGGGRLYMNVTVPDYAYTGPLSVSVGVISP
jgi:hypothetical protein